MASITAPTALISSLSQLKQGFATADTDKSGALSFTEFQKAAETNTGLTGTANQGAAAVFKKLDTSGDGQLSANELTQGINLNTQVQAVLLQGQELMSGSAFMQLLGGTGTNATSSLFGSTNDFSSLTSNLMGAGSSSSLSSLLGAGASDTTNAYAGLFGGNINTTLIQQVLAKYQPVAEEPATTTQSA
ncbi:MAG: hypothetical protein DI585_01745 [Pseudomonas fluorescens]|nr:MAG: hypothetical protein DI585_01745 [Pseudomonas fluorescens]